MTIEPYWGGFFEAIYHLPLEQREMRGFLGTRALEIVKRNNSSWLLWKHIKLTIIRKNNAKKCLPSRMADRGNLEGLCRATTRTYSKYCSCSCSWKQIDQIFLSINPL
ncbi:unnamed protein product [Musa textilis]